MEHRSNLARALDHRTTTATQRQRGRLIILEANSFARSALARFFVPRYEHVHACDCLRAAESGLSAEVDTCTDLIVGGHLAADVSGYGVATTWRLRYPQLRRVVLATGSDWLPADTASVDAVFRKPFNVQELGLFLGS